MTSSGGGAGCGRSGWFRWSAGGEGGGQVAVAGAVDLLDPGLEAGDGFGPVGGRELPPRRRREGAVAVRVGVGRRGVGELFQGGLVLAEGVADAGDEFGELGELVVVVGELLERCGDRVVGHGQFQGWEVPSPVHSAGTWSGTPRGWGTETG